MEQQLENTMETGVEGFRVFLGRDSLNHNQGRPANILWGLKAFFSTALVF